MDKLAKENKVDFFLRTNKEWARVRSCGIIIENDCVLMVTNESVDYLYSVGGAIHVGETSEEACVREIFEETGINFEVERIVFLHENFFVGEESELCHEIAFYYLMKSKGSMELKSSSYGLNGAKEKIVRIPLTEYGNYVAYPTFFGDELINLPNTVKHIITNEINPLHNGDQVLIVQYMEIFIVKVCVDRRRERPQSRTYSLGSARIRLT